MAHIGGLLLTGDARLQDPTLAGIQNMGPRPFGGQRSLDPALTPLALMWRPLESESVRVCPRRTHKNLQLF